MSLFSEALSAEIPGESVVSWEEDTAVGMTHLLRTVLAKNVNEAGVQLPLLEMMQSTEKLKKLISKVLDKIASGALKEQCP